MIECILIFLVVLSELQIALISIEWVNNAVAANEKLILVDGIRSWAEVETFRRIYPNFTVENQTQT